MIFDIPIHVALVTIGQPNTDQNPFDETVVTTTPAERSQYGQAGAPSRVDVHCQVSDTGR